MATATDLKIHPLPKQLLIYWPTPPRITRLLRTIDLPPRVTREPRLLCGQFDGEARAALQRLAQSAVDGLLFTEVRANVLTRRRAAIVSALIAGRSETEPLAELLPSEGGGAVNLIARARQRALSLAVHVPGAARDGAVAFVTEYEFSHRVHQHYLARLFVRGSDAAQWERPQG